MKTLSRYLLLALFVMAFLFTLFVPAPAEASTRRPKKTHHRNAYTVRQIKQYRKGSHYYHHTLKRQKRQFKGFSAGN